MKKCLISIVMLLLMSGCALDLMTRDNPLGFVDPNQGTAIFETGSQIAGTTQTVGTVTGNPALIGIFGAS